jgi:hypothetical protein
MLGSIASVKVGWSGFTDRNGKDHEGFSARKCRNGHYMRGPSKGIFLSEALFEFVADEYKSVLDGQVPEVSMELYGGLILKVLAVKVGERDGISVNLSYPNGDWKGNLWLSLPDATWFLSQLQEGRKWIA